MQSSYSCCCSVCRCLRVYIWHTWLPFYAALRGLPAAPSLFCIFRTRWSCCHVCSTSADQLHLLCNLKTYAVCLQFELQNSRVPRAQHGCGRRWALCLHWDRGLLSLVPQKDHWLSGYWLRFLVLVFLPNSTGMLANGWSVSTTAVDSKVFYLQTNTSYFI